MIVVAFHYRIIGDENLELKGSWNEFSSFQKANIWLEQRTTKTPFSPQGTYLKNFDTLDEVPANYDDWDFGGLDSSVLISLEKAIRSYIKYCNEKKKMFPLQNSKSV